MALDNTDLFLVQDATTKANYKIEFQKLQEDFNLDGYVAVSGDNMTGDLTLGTDNITLNASDGSATFAGSGTFGGGGTFAGDVGIGTDNPATTLELSSSDPRLTIRDTDQPTRYTQLRNTNGDTYLSQISSGSMIFGVPTEAMRVNFDGNVGIGTNNPQAKLDVMGTLAVSATTQINAPSDFWSSSSYYDVGSQGSLSTQGAFAVHLTSNGYRNNAGTWTSFNKNGTTGASQIQLNPTGYIDFNTDTNKATGSSSTPTFRMRIDDTGNVGIGTGNPQRKLEVDGTFQAGQSFMTATPGTAGALHIGVTGVSGWNTTLLANGDARFAGNVGIGTDNPQVKLHVVDDLATGIRSQSYSSQNTNTNKALHVSNGDTTDTFNVSYRGQGYFAGNVGIGTNFPQELLNIQSDEATLAINTTRNGTNYGNSSILFGSPRNDTADGDTKGGRGKLSCLGNENSGAGILWLQAGSASLGGNATDTANKASQCGLRLESDGSIEHWHDNTLFTKTTANGNVGIGTDDPGGKLTVNTPADVSTWQFRVQTDGLSNESGFYRDKDNGFIFDIRDDSGAVTIGMRAKEGRITAKHYDLEFLPALP